MIATSFDSRQNRAISHQACFDGSCSSGGAIVSLFRAGLLDLGEHPWQSAPGIAEPW